MGKTIPKDQQKDQSVHFKCHKDLLNAFKETCEQNDRTVSQILRDYMREYVKKHRQGELKL